MDIGSVADICAAGASTMGLFISYRALGIARDANKTAEDSRKDAQRLSERALAFEAEQARKNEMREDLRDASNAAAKFEICWAIRRVAPNTTEFGIYLCLKEALHDLCIVSSSNKHPQNAPINLTHLGCGHYFFTSLSLNEPDAWRAPQSVESTSVELMKRSEKYQIDEFSFTDNAGHRWTKPAGKELQRA